MRREKRVTDRGEPPSAPSLYQRPEIPLPPPSAGPRPEGARVLRYFEWPQYFAMTEAEQEAWDAEHGTGDGAPAQDAPGPSSAPWEEQSLGDA